MPKPARVRKIGAVIDNFVAPFAQKGFEIGITADHVTFLQAPFVLTMAYFLMRQSILAAVGMLVVSLILDVLDGSWARATKENLRERERERTFTGQDLGLVRDLCSFNKYYVCIS